MDRQRVDVLPNVLDRDNHCIDAIRYALHPLIRSRQSMGTLALIEEDFARRRVGN